MAATIKDIALEAGLATATVSAYLNGQKVRQENKTAIETAIKKLGYIRNDYARGLKIHKSSTVGVIIYDLSDRFGTSVICSIEEHLSRYGYGILVCDYKTSGRSFDETVKFLMTRMIDGLILVMPSKEDADSLDVVINAGLPVVSVDRILDRDDITQIVIDNYSSVKRATDSLVKRGHKDIGLICGDTNIYTHFERHRGYMDSLTEKGIYTDENVFNGQMTVFGGYEATKKCLENEKITAIISTSYHMTVGTMLAVGSFEGKRKIDIVGFDSAPLKSMTQNYFGSIIQPTEKIGEAASQSIISSINNKNTDRKVITFNAILEI